MKFINFKNEKLFLDECEIESPKENQIQIEVHSTGVNRADILQKKGHYPPPKGESEIIGLECAGIVCKIGPNSSKFKVGDKVCAILGGGGYAEFVNVDERQVMPIPSNVSLLEAGALPETILTVYENIFNISEFKNIKSKDAIKHPTWDMGKKISVDSSTMMNKIFEFIEAKKIFNIEKEKIQILIHPTSFVHAIVFLKGNLIKFLNNLLRTCLYYSGLKTRSQ